jgi:hypothetical protein
VARLVDLGGVFTRVDILPNNSHDGSPRTRSSPRLGLFAVAMRTSAGGANRKPQWSRPGERQCSFTKRRAALANTYAASRRKRCRRGPRTR